MTATNRVLAAIKKAATRTYLRNSGVSSNGRNVGFNRNAADKLVADEDFDLRKQASFNHEAASGQKRGET